MADEIPQIEDYYLPTGATGTYTVTTQNGKGTISISIGNDEFALANEKQATTIDDDLALAGILDEQKIIFKQHLMNKMLSDFDAELTVPQAPTNSPLISQMKAGNDLKQKQHEREIQLAKVEVEYKKADIQAKLKTIKLQEEANAIQQLQLNMQGKLYEQNERIIKQTSTLLTNIAKLKSVIAQKEYTLSTDNLNLGDVKLDTAPIVEALNTISSNQIETNEKIVEGINSQTAVNNKTLEKINQELSKDVEIDGVKYNSIDLEKNKNKEVFIGSKDENETLLNDGLELVEEALTDGFDVNINPLALLTEAFAEFVLQDKNELITKFNINDKGVV